MTTTTEIRWCGGCAAEAVFERFDCADHPDDCLELICTACGAGVEAPGYAVQHDQEDEAPLDREAAA